MNFKNK